MVGCSCYGQLRKIELYAVLDGGYDRNLGTLMAERKHQNYHYLLSTTAVNALNSYAGLQVYLLDRFQFTAKFGYTDMGSGIKYHDASSGFGLAGARIVSWILGPRKKVNYDNGLVTTTWRQPYMRITVTTAYTFYKMRFKKGIFNHFGINFNEGVGIDYSFLSKNRRTDSLKTFHPLSLGKVKVKGLEKQNRNGAGGVLAGLNAQIFYKEKKQVKFGVWFHDILHPNVEYLINLSYDGKEDNVKLYSGKN